MNPQHKKPPIERLSDFQIAQPGQYTEHASLGNAHMSTFTVSWLPAVMPFGASNMAKRHR